MNNNWDDFVNLYDWEFNLINKEQHDDTNMWMSLCREYGSKILEIGAGTGRITTHLLSCELKVTAVDNAPAFIDKLIVSNSSALLKTVVCDMRELDIDDKFSFCFFGYTTFQYLLTYEDQKKCLESLKPLLMNDGRVGFDLDPSICELPELDREILLYKEYYSPDECMISMFTKHNVDHINQITHWTDRYYYHKQIPKELVHSLSLKGVTLESMRKLFDEVGFEIESVFGGFKFTEYNESSDRLIIIAKIR